MSGKTGKESTRGTGGIITAFYGLRQVHARLTHSLGDVGTPPEHALAPLTEALWWAVSANEGLWKLKRASYKTNRAVNADGRYFSAVKYARDRCGHQRALAIVREGLAPPYGPPFTPGTLIRWRQQADLPQADRGFDNPTGAQAYRDLLAGESARTLWTSMRSRQSRNNSETASTSPRCAAATWRTPGRSSAGVSEVVAGSSNSSTPSAGRNPLATHSYASSMLPRNDAISVLIGR